MRDWVICGWYTPDYRGWAEALQANLEEVGAPFDLVETAKVQGGWERNTLRKPFESQAAIKRHPGKTVVMLDVDAQVVGTLDELDDIFRIEGDIGAFVRTKFRSSGKPLFAPRSGTMVFRPTPKAQALANEWIEACRHAPRYAVDQDALLVALGKVPSLSLTMLPIEACGTQADNCKFPVVLHDQARGEARKAGKIRKGMDAFIGLAARHGVNAEFLKRPK